MNPSSRGSYLNEKTTPGGHHQGMGHHSGPDATRLVACMAAEPSEDARQQCPSPIGETAKPKVSRPENDGSEDQRDCSG